MSDTFLDKDMYEGLGDTNDPFALSQADTTTVLDAVFGADSDSEDAGGIFGNANNTTNNISNNNNNDDDDVDNNNNNTNNATVDDAANGDATLAAPADEEKAEVPTVQTKKRELTFFDIAAPSFDRLDASRELLIFDVPGQVSLDSVPYSGRGHPLDAQSDAVIRWRVAADGTRESNARLVRWQDGSMDLMIGNEILVGKLSDVTDGLCYQYVRQDQGGLSLLEAHTRLTRRLGVVPRTAGGAVPVRVARAVTARHTEQKKSEIKIFTAHQDPERDKREKEMIEEQRIQLRNRQLGIKARAGSLSEFLEEGEHSDRDERSFDELAEDGDVGAIKEQFGSRSARNRRKKRQMADRQEAELERRLERAKRSHEEDAAVGGDDLGVDDGATPSAAAATTTATTTAGTSRIVPIADVIAAEAAAGPKRKAPVIAATDDDD